MYFCTRFCLFNRRKQQQWAHCIRNCRPASRCRTNCWRFCCCKRWYLSDSVFRFSKCYGCSDFSATFQIIINDEIIVASSITETTTSKQLVSMQLFSFLESDIVKLVADIPEGMSYSMATMQVVHVGYISADWHEFYSVLDSCILI